MSPRARHLQWRWAWVAIGFGLAGVQGAAPPPAGLAPIHVATNGNDGWTGALAAPNADRTDGPLATIARARDIIRQAKRSPEGLRSAVRVVIHGGTYALPAPIVFTTEDGGSADRPIEYAAAEGETPIVSGGRRIAGWRAVEMDGRKVMAADLPAVRAGGWYFHQLWINGERRPRARHPNQGYLAVAEIPDAKSDTPWHQGQAAFRYAAGDLESSPGIRQAEVCVMNRWIESHLPITDIDESNRIVRFGKRSVFKLDAGDLYYVENAREHLDRPGEWWLDGDSGVLYCLPRAGEDLERAEVIAPVLTQLMRLEGQPETKRWIEHLAFRGIVFAHTEWYFPGGFDSGRQQAEVWPPPAAAVGGFAQAAIGVPGSVYGTALRHAIFDQCRWIHLGGYGLELGRGCRDNRIQRCELADLGAGGIKLGETAIRDSADEVARDNEVSDCHIHDGGRFFHSAIGIWIGQSPGNRIRHNLIHDFYYSGISAGWTWGYGRALATNTVVELNHVHHIGKLSNGDGPILSDMAGIYTLGRHAGSVIRSNLWHDVAGLRYGGWGIYFDEGTSEILAENNLVLRTTHGGFHQHYGRDNRVRNNVFLLARDFQVQRTRAEEHLSFRFERNVVGWQEGKLLDGNFSGTNYVFDSNLYWPPSGQEARFAEWSWDEWRQRGQDVHSQIADPRFMDPGTDDFRLRGDSPALRLGIRPFDLRDVGPRRASAR